MKTSLVNNISALKVQSNTKKVKSKLDKNLQKLSTGKRVNSAADDAAGLSIASKLRSKVRSSRRAMRNSSDAISFVQVAEGSLSTVQDALIRLKEITIKNATDTLGDGQRHMNNIEFRELKAEIKRVSRTTELFSKKLLDGNISGMEIQVGVNKGDNNKITIDTKLFSATLDALGIFDIDADTRQRSLKSMRKFEYAIQEVARARAYFGSMASVLQSNIGNMDTSIQNTDQAKGRIMDADYAKQTAAAARNGMIKNAGVSVQAQANGTSALALKILGGSNR